MTPQQKEMLLDALHRAFFVTSFARRATIEYEDEIRAAIKELESIPTTEEV